MNVGTICSRNVETIPEGVTVLDASRKMHDHKVGTLVICSEHNTPVGILTDRDITDRIIAAGLDPTSTTVEEVMTGKVQCIEEHAPIHDALQLMRSVPCRRLPVVHRSRALMGIVSLDDVLAWFAAELSSVAELLREESPESLAAP